MHTNAKGRTFSHGPSTKKSTPTYKTLAEIGIKDRFVNVFAVVKFFKKPHLSKGTDWVFFLNLVDPTLYENEKVLKCMCFEPDPKEFPVIQDVGDIVRFTSLKISIDVNNNNLTVTGKSKIGFSWATFIGRPGAPIVPRCSFGSDCQINEYDKRKIEELRAWASTVPFLTPVSKRMTLGELTSQNVFFDLVCQVVYFEKPSCCSASGVIHVWDGTVPGVASILSSHQSLATKTIWRDNVIDKCAKIFVFSDENNVHISPKAGDYVQIKNLHLKPKTTAYADPLQPQYCLVLHERGDNGRGITVLREDEKDVRVLTTRMQGVSNIEIMEETEDIVRGVYKYSRTALLALKIPKNTSTHLANPEYLPPSITCIKSMKSSNEVPSLFLIKARLHVYWPKQALEFVKYVCHTCESIHSPSDVAQPDSDINILRPCLTCGKPLSLSLCFTLILRDNEQFIDVVLFDTAAKAFFPDVEPVVLYDNKPAQEWVEKRLNCLLRRGVWVEYVILCYYSRLVTTEGAPVPVYRVIETRFPVELEKRLKQLEDGY